MKKLLLLLALSMTSLAQAETDTHKPVDITVYRSASCMCCGKWLAHLNPTDFTVHDNVLAEMDSIKQKYGVSAEMASCHTALVDGYVIEGHVPSNDILKLLKIRPQVAGIAVPGMPKGTPGMEMGEGRDAYNVISFNKENKYDIFNRYEATP